MRIVVNSDILFTQRLVITDLPPHLQKLAVECGKVGAVIVLPQTALLEVERRQRQLMETEISAVERAYNTLRNVGVNLEERQSSEFFSLPDFAELFRSAGAKVVVEVPLLEDFSDAHRRAWKRR